MSRTHALLTRTTLTLLAAGCGSDTSQPLGPQSSSAPAEAPAFSIPSKIKRSQEAALAFFFSERGCLRTDVSVVGRKETENFAVGHPTLTNVSASVGVEQFDLCENQILHFWQGGTFLHDPGVVLKVDNQLSTASLQVTILANDLFGGSELPVAVDLSWTATGPIVTGSFVDRHTGSDFVSIVTSSGSSRVATASGSITMDGINLTPGPSSEARIEEAERFQLRVVHR
jgi:hypothetical protein